MIMQPIASSNVFAAGWADNVLRIEFKGGSYDYDKVPFSVFEQLMAAESKGSFVHTDIKPHYTGVKTR